MVSIKAFIATSIALIAVFVNVEASVSPSYPSPGTIQIAGQSYEITWSNDGKDPKTTYTIDFMTGSNDIQTKLKTVATNVPANALKYSFVAPQVSPNSAIYFFMFTGSDGEFAWTTRFGIAGADGKLTKEDNSTQTNGDAIPWGIGKLIDDASVSANASSAPAPASASASVPVTPAPVTPAPGSSAVPSSTSSIAKMAVAAADSSSVESSTRVPSVAQVASNNDVNNDANSGSMVKPALTLVTAAVAAYFAL